MNELIFVVEEAPEGAAAAGAAGAGADLVEQDRIAELLFVSEGVAHEALNPLAYVRYALAELRGTLADPSLPEGLRADAADLLDTASGGLDRVEAVLADLRAHALREASPDPVVVDLHASLARTVRLLRLKCPEGVTIETDLCADGRARCRELRMQQVFFNLILNAVQAVGGRGRVAVRSFVEGPQFCVSVRDDGPGIPAEHIGRLFRPFFTTKDPSRASGLGLAVSYRIVKEHGGDIHAQPRAGKGAEFVVRIPRGV